MSAITDIFKAPKSGNSGIVASPAPASLPAAPSRTDAATASLAKKQRTSFFNRKGRTSTFLTSGGKEEGSAALRFLGGS